MTTPVYDRFGVSVYQGDCLNVMRTLPDASVSAVITDPPYGLADLSTKRVVSALTKWLAGDREFIPAGAGGFMQKTWDTFVPPPAVWDECYRVLKPGGHLLAFAGTRTVDLMGLSLRLAGFEYRNSIGSPMLAWMHAQGFPKGHAQLKPSWEPIIMVRKPLAGTAAATVLAHGTGVLYIDACRVDMSDADRVVVDNRSGSASRQIEGWGTRGDYAAGRRFTSDTAGRWPPNTVLTHAALLDPVTGEPIGDACASGCVDGCGVAELDRQSFGTRSEKPSASGTVTGSGMWGIGGERNGATYTDSGGASRFFPCFRWEAKASTAERPMVNGKAWPTVKPVSLMRWLVKLVTPPGGVVLDCFAGTGTTGQGARAEGFPAILIEQDPDAISMIRARLDAKPKTEAATAARTVEDAPQDLFDLLGDAS